MNIGFISTRLAGTDGVSLEAAKWASIFESEGHLCFYMAGELDKDKPNQRSLLVEEMVQHNYELGKRYYSYSVLRQKLKALLSNCFGV